LVVDFTCHSIRGQPEAAGDLARELGLSRARLALDEERTLEGDRCIDGHHEVGGRHVVGRAFEFHRPCIRDTLSAGKPNRARRLSKFRRDKVAETLYRVRSETIGAKAEGPPTIGDTGQRPRVH
jgi:hypothetical protein